MASSFRLTPNIAKGGDTLRCEVQGITKQSDYQGKTFSIQINELDSGKDGGKAGNKNDLLAEFSATIVNTGSKQEPKLAFENVSRTDTLPTELPKAEIRKSPEGDILSYTPDWKTPHFMLTFATASGSSNPFRILMRGDAGEREGYAYEIGFKVLIANRAVFDSSKMPLSLDCSDYLAHNCVEGALTQMRDHQELVVKRGIGLRYGSDCEYTDLEADKTSYKITSSDCITYQTEAAALGHEKSLANMDWIRIKSHMKSGKGTLLFKGYVEAGWIGLYYNPDIKHPADRDDEHPASYRSVAKMGKYYDIPVTDSVVNYSPTLVYDDGAAILPAEVTAKDAVNLEKLKKVPFGVMIVRGGRHTAILMKGKVYEVHWKKGPRDLDLYGVSDFETEWEWLSGMIMVPPGKWV